MASLLQKKCIRYALTVSQKKFAYKPLIGRKASTLADSFYNEEQKELQNTVKKLIDAEINPHADQWEKDKIFPCLLYTSDAADE